MTTMETRPTPTAAVDGLQELDRLLREEAIESVYQPIVELDGGATVAYEALARGPVDSPLHLPGALFGAAHRADRLVDLDWACRAAALRGALGTALERPTALFVNIEPIASMARVPEQFGELVQGAKDHLQVVFEFTERALTDRPAEVLRAVTTLRALGAMIALDDVGVDPRSLALMPFLRPDVIKLDMSIVQGAQTPQMARTMHAVNAHAERTGAVVLAEGIETAEHLEHALALGATHGQGWLFGRPGPAPTLRVMGSRQLHRAVRQDRDRPADWTPFDEVATRGTFPRVATKRLLLALSHQLEVQAEDLGPEAVVVANLQTAKHFTPATRARYGALAEQAAFVGVLGQDICAQPEPGVRGGELVAGDPLRREWNVCVISPHFAAAMVARDLGDDGPDMDRRFEYHLTYSRDIAVRSALPMMARIAGQV
jgi:EAL domain-containing protein (putative c-di-GMP-specific phosphodiesterase class I)